jgi:hypothetical protein
LRERFFDRDAGVRVLTEILERLVEQLSLPVVDGGWPEEPFLEDAEEVRLVLFGEL